MSVVPQGTLNWLYNVLGKDYRDPNRAYSDLAHTLSVYPTLSPRTEVYTFDNGASALLLHFVGTLPVSFRGATYRFPIALWIPYGYPQEAPMAYVRPTEDMLVRPGQHVSGDGRIYHHYLARWSEVSNRVNVVELLKILSEVFTKEPPVISRKEMMTRPNMSSPSPVPPPRPPLPEELQRLSPRLQSHTPEVSTPPLPPPKTAAVEESPTANLTRNPGRYDAPLPLPIPPNDGRPAPTSLQPNGHAISPRNQPQNVPQRSESLRQSLAVQQMQRSTDSQHHLQASSDPYFITPRQDSASPVSIPISSPAPQRPFSIAGPSSLPSPGPPYRAYSFSQRGSHSIPQRSPPLVHQNQPQSYNASNITPQPQVKAQPVDLLSSPFEIALPTTSPIPAPPVPRNPEKDAMLSHLSRVLTQTLHQKVSQNTSALASLRAQNVALVTAQANLGSEVPQLMALQSTLQSNISILHSALASADHTISAAHSRSAANDLPSVDDMLVPPTVVAKQLYDTVCDERGIEAGLWSLQIALGRGRIGIESWAKRGRELAREGFRRKWLAKKIGRGMGLSDGG